MLLCADQPLLSICRGEQDAQTEFRYSTKAILALPLNVGNVGLSGASGPIPYSSAASLPKLPVKHVDTRKVLGYSTYRELPYQKQRCLTVSSVPDSAQQQRFGQC